MNILEEIVGLAGAAAPPRRRGPGGLRRWMNMIWGWLILGSLFGAFHVAWACSWLPGMPGFAMSKDVQTVQDTLGEMRKQQVERDIFTTRILQCAAKRDGNGRVYSEKLSELQGDYRSMTGMYMPLADCAEL